MSSTTVYMERDFTYVDDVAEGVVRGRADPCRRSGVERRAPDPGTSAAPYRLYNIGNHQPVKLPRLIEILEDCLGRKAVKQLLPMQPGDVLSTYADINDLARNVGFAFGSRLRMELSSSFAGTGILSGVRRFSMDGEAIFGLRTRVVEAIDAGATIPEAAEQCGVSIKSVVRSPRASPRDG